MPTESLGAEYFDGIFRNDVDPWSLASSAYEAAKFDVTVAAISDRRYARTLEIGCAHGVLTGRLAPLCDDLLAIDISDAALERAAVRLAATPNVRFDRIAFPREAPAATSFDLIVASEIAYYWSDADLVVAGRWLSSALASDGRLLLVHWLGETDYPQTGDGAVEALHCATAGMTVDKAIRTPEYRLDLWQRA